MKLHKSNKTFSYIVLVLFSVLSTATYASDRVALLIANQDYTRGDLKNPVNDAKLIQKKLKKLNYDVTVLTDANETQMIQAISNFGQKAKGADSAIFYYSGHGMQDKYKQNYLIPVDAKISSDASIRAEGVNVEEVVSEMNDARARVSIVILDACRDNPYAKVRGSRNFQVEAYEMPDSRFLVSYATQSGQVAQDGDGKNSPFAIALSEQLDIARNTPIMLMFSNVRDRVNALTNNEQSPVAKGDVGYYTGLLSKKNIMPSPVQDNKPIPNPVQVVTRPTPSPTPVAVSNPSITDNSDVELFRYKENGKYGFENNQTGEVVIPAQYDNTWGFSEGLANVKKNGKWGFINKQGKIVIPFQYDDVSNFSEGLNKVKKNDKWGFINKQGKVVIPLQYDDVWGFSEGLVNIKKNGKWGYINKQGDIVIPFQYDYAWGFSKGLAEVKKNGKWGFINKKGDWVRDKYK